MNTIHRRGILAGGAAFGLGAALARPAAAQGEAWPARPVRIVVPFTPGGASDIFARLVSQKLGPEFGQPFVVENRPGAAANLGADYVARAAPDAYTLLLLSTVHAINPSLYRNLGYDPVRSFAPVSMIAATAQVIVVHPSLPVRSLPELIAHARANPDRLNYSTVGAGSQPHLATALFCSRTGIRMTHVPYRGAAEAMTAILANEVAVTFATSPSAVPHVRAGALRALAVTSAHRIAALPDVPTAAEAGVPDFEVLGWNGLVAPAGAPEPLLTRLNAAVVKLMGEDGLRRTVLDQGAEPWTTTPREFGAYIEAERNRWAEVVRAAGVSLD
ncbi:MAG TPA: tripartite tricarboxylate transporter substrate binding protein [Roseomonas sp.]|jgi:tripartite-type tricarboxylate transporter receptor subunit TctC